MAERHDGTLELYAGASRCGKTSLMMERIMKAPRALVWDVQGQFGMYQGWEVVRTLHDLADRLEAPGEDNAPARISYQPERLEDFDVFCRIAYAWCVQGPAMVVVEELADVTNHGKACAGWGILTRRGLKYGPSILAAIQRPQWADKDTMGNATHLVIFRQGDGARAYLEKLSVPGNRIPTEPHTYHVRKGGEAGEWTGPLKTRELPPPPVKGAK